MRAATDSVQLIGAGGYAASFQRAPAADRYQDAVPSVSLRAVASKRQKGFCPMELAGLEPATFALPARRSPN
jgi:hypothetical protein